MSAAQLHIYSTALGSVIGAINAGLDGKGAVAVHASSRGMRITFDGRTVAKGKTPDALHANFIAEVAKAKAGTR